MYVIESVEGRSQLKSNRRQQQSGRYAKTNREMFAAPLSVENGCPVHFEIDPRRSPRCPKTMVELVALACEIVRVGVAERRRAEQVALPQQRQTGPRFAQEYGENRVGGQRECGVCGPEQRRATARSTSSRVNADVRLPGLLHAPPSPAVRLCSSQVRVSKFKTNVLRAEGLPPGHDPSPSEKGGCDRGRGQNRTYSGTQCVETSVTQSASSASHEDGQEGVWKLVIGQHRMRVGGLRRLNVSGYAASSASASLSSSTTCGSMSQERIRNSEEASGTRLDLERVPYPPIRAHAAARTTAQCTYAALRGAWRRQGALDRLMTSRLSEPTTLTSTEHSRCGRQDDGGGESGLEPHGGAEVLSPRSCRARVLTSTSACALRGRGRERDAKGDGDVHVKLEPEVECWPGARLGQNGGGDAATRSGILNEEERRRLGCAQALQCRTFSTAPSTRKEGGGKERNAGSVMEKAGTTVSSAEVSSGDSVIAQES
ncbi:hypothetical protein B0H12DRAFT_1067276 [Mycena haematopus]|nr:hypothetical protein B0H12DRAFT_1067276 [Mycena haematopus]